MSTEALHGAAISLEEIVAQDPTTAFYLPLAERLLDRGSVAEAVRLCEERRSRPGHGVGDHIVLGRCYLADGRLLEAGREFRAALLLDRENVIALKSLAGILSHEGRHADAADLYRAVCRVDPGDLESQTALHQITSGDYPEVRPAEVIVGQGDLAWQPVRLTREEDHLSELGLGLRTLEPHDEGRLRPSTSDAATGARLEPTVVDAPIELEPPLEVEPPAPAAPPAAALAETSTLGHPRPTDPFEDRLGGIDVGAFQESALERLEEALRPIEARPLGEIEPVVGSGASRSAIWSVPERPPGARPDVLPAPPPPAAASASSNRPLPAPEPPAVEPAARGNRAAFETWLRNLGFGPGGGDAGDDRGARGGEGS